MTKHKDYSKHDNSSSQELLTYLNQCGQLHAVESLRNNPSVLKLTVKGMRYAQEEQMLEIIKLLGNDQNITKLKFYVSEDIKHIISRAKYFIEFFQNDENIKANNKIESFKLYVTNRLLEYLYKCKQTDAANSLIEKSNVLKFIVSTSNPNQEEQIKKICEILGEDEYITKIKVIANKREDYQLAKDVIEVFKQDENVKNNSNIVEFTHLRISSSKEDTLPEYIRLSICGNNDKSPTISSSEDTGTADIDPDVCCLGESII
ncbi:MAG: hypothetical protein EOP33_01055 [Rickettsiaceae bacterium]|nr:MAG: hypothetical protein EOP33_01055 [Rickettsiaceae bacterium]